MFLNKCDIYLFAGIDSYCRLSLSWKSISQIELPRNW